MLAFYVDRETRSILDCQELIADSLYMITRINVPREHRLKGVGTKLLQECMQQADEEKVDLCLLPKPSDGPGREVLATWYQHNGFMWDVLDQKYGLMMVRRYAR
jgi:GNAT superfamily N-acetyltransferase